MNDWKLNTKVKSKFIGYINNHEISYKNVYYSAIKLLTAIQDNKQDLCITRPAFLINDIIYVLTSLHTEGGPNDLKYIEKILLPKLQTINYLSDLIPVLEDLVGPKGFHELTRLRDSLTENLYTS